MGKAYRANWYRVAADSLTGMRLIIAGIILILAKTEGSEGFTSVSLLCLLGWTADSLDGHFARQHGFSGNTWLSKNDRTVDLIMILASWVYLVMAGFVAKWLAWTYTIGATLAGLYFHSKLVLLIVESLPVLAIPIISLSYVPNLGYAWILWAMIITVLDRKRLKIRIEILLEDFSHSRQKRVV